MPTSTERLNQFFAQRAVHQARCDIAITASRDDAARAEALAADAAGRATFLLAVKANVDVEGWVTHAGSQAMLATSPAESDAPFVAALRRAGAIVVAQTNMTEFAYSGLGMNSHFGTPTTPLDDRVNRIAGGSSSGSAVAVALGLVDAAVGTDTSGSVRLPAAFCGVVGFMPSPGRYSTAGIVPLATSFDVPGLITPTVRRCRAIDAAMTGGPPPRSGADRRETTVIVAEGLRADDTSDEVAAAFEAAVDALQRAGCIVVRRRLPYLDEIGDIARAGGIVAAEAHAWHAPLLATSAHLYDPRIRARIEGGAALATSDYLRAKTRLAELAARYHADTAGADVMLSPSAPVLPPAITELDDAEGYTRLGMLVIRFTEIANRIGVPSISLPLPARDGRRQPVGLLLHGHRGRDEALLATASRIASIVGPNEAR